MKMNKVKTTIKPYYQKLVNHYEKCFEQYGETPQGVDWPNAKDLDTRFSIMFDLFKNAISKKPFKLLDLGCGYGAFYDYLKKGNCLNKIDYMGIDLSFKLIQSAARKHGSLHFEYRDVLTDKLQPTSFDYIVMNGLFTEKNSLTHSEMKKFFIDMIKTSFDACRVGIAFNIMNFHVDWFREDLFYLSFDQLAIILKRYASRHFTVRADYGLYEYTVYAYKQPNDNRG
ncbi:MAG: methyltransferase type 12 [uncultured bacterium]|nr:MAG: methyltransferase type 12 [uncultured bacterium]